VRLPALDEIDRELARRSLAEFVRQAWPTIEGSTPLVWNWHIEILCAELQAWSEGRRERQNLALNVPPGSMKSTIVSVCYPAWRWLKDPSYASLFVSGADDVAMRDSMKCRNIVTSEWYRAFGCPWRLAADQDAKGWFRNTAGGERQATTIGSRGTGKRVHDVFFDDPNDTKDVSAAKLDAVWDSYRLTFQNRLKNMVTGGRVLIQQRTHMRDLSGMLASEDGEAWRFVVLRQEWEADDPDAHPNDPRTVPGQLIFPERFPASVVASEKRVLGQVGYAGQHQQRPVPREGGMFKADRVEVMESAPAGLKMCRGWDQAASSGRGDYTVGALLGKDTDGAWWIVDIVRQQTDEPRALLKQAAATDGKSVPISWPQDPGAAGKDQAKSLTSDMAGYTFHTSPETGAKETRWEPFSSQVNGRNVKMVRAPWNRALLEEMQTAPRGANDDMLDALARAFSYLTNQRSGLIDYYASAG
jgi:predicted phage terminase large subunit-like protein